MGLVAEMIQLGPEILHEHILHFFNQIIFDCKAPDEWLTSFFTLIPKSGNLKQVQNWRLIAILRIMQKLFSRMIYNRLQSNINQKLPYDQCAFRPSFSIEDALYIVSILLGKCSEFNIPVWAASLDMQQALDRVEHEPIFEVLRYFADDESLIVLIQLVYVNQSDTMDGSHHFDILRGVGRRSSQRLTI